MILRKYLRPKRFTILGGEPLLHPNIGEIAAIARASGMFGRICVTTNGLHLASMTASFFSNIDSITVSIYPTTRDRLATSWPEIANHCAAYGVSLEKRIIYDFNLIIYPECNPDSNKVTDVFYKCVYKHYCHALRDGVLYRCSPVVQMDQFFARVGRIERVSCVNSLPISDSPNLRENIINLFCDETPLVGCQFCLGSSGPRFAHRQLTRVEVNEPLNLVCETKCNRADNQSDKKVGEIKPC
jgi:hypothetical protein